MAKHVDKVSSAAQQVEDVLSSNVNGDRKKFGEEGSIIKEITIRNDEGTPLLSEESLSLKNDSNSDIIEVSLHSLRSDGSYVEEVISDCKTFVLVVSKWMSLLHKVRRRLAQKEQMNQMEQINEEVTSHASPEEIRETLPDGARETPTDAQGKRTDDQRNAPSADERDSSETSPASNTVNCEKPRSKKKKRKSSAGKKSAKKEKEIKKDQKDGKGMKKRKSAVEDKDEKKPRRKSKASVKSKKSKKAGKKLKDLSDANTPSGSDESNPEGDNSPQQEQSEDQPERRRSSVSLYIAMGEILSQTSSEQEPMWECNLTTASGMSGLTQEETAHLSAKISNRSTKIGQESVIRSQLSIESLSRVDDNDDDGDDDDEDTDAGSEYVCSDSNSTVVGEDELQELIEREERNSQLRPPRNFPDRYASLMSSRQDSELDLAFDKALNFEDGGSKAASATSLDGQKEIPSFAALEPINKNTTKGHGDESHLQPSEDSADTDEWEKILNFDDEESRSELSMLREEKEQIALINNLDALGEPSLNESYASDKSQGMHSRSDHEDSTNNRRRTNRLLRNRPSPDGGTKNGGKTISSTAAQKDGDATTISTVNACDEDTLSSKKLDSREQSTKRQPRKGRTPASMKKINEVEDNDDVATWSTPTSATLQEPTSISSSIYSELDDDSYVDYEVVAVEKVGPRRMGRPTRQCGPAPVAPRRALRAQPRRTTRMPSKKASEWVEVHSTTRVSFSSTTPGYGWPKVGEVLKGIKMLVSVLQCSRKTRRQKPSLSKPNRSTSKGTKGPRQTISNSYSSCRKNLKSVHRNSSVKKVPVRRNRNGTKLIVRPSSPTQRRR